MVYEYGDRVKIVGTTQEFQVISAFVTPTETFYDLRIGQDLSSMRRASESDLALVAKAQQPRSQPRLIPATNILDY